MELTLFITFLIISFILIGLYFYRTEHAELGIIGFLFVFILGITVIAGGVQYITSTTTNTTYFYDATNTTLLNSSATMTNNYDSIDPDGPLNHLAGYYLTVMAGIGLIGVFISFKNQRF